MLTDAFEFALDFENSLVFEQYMDDTFLSDSFDAKEAFTLMKQEARRTGILLSDMDSFDYETFFLRAYGSMQEAI